MRVTLVHNPNAGDRGMDLDEMVSALAALGWRVRAVDRSDLDEALRAPGDAVLVAGGDGTVGKVAKRLAGTGVPLGVIPTGTANNVARTLGIGVDARSAIASLVRVTIRDADLGVVRNGHAEGERFLEGFGVGVLARVMAEGGKKHKDKELRRAFGRIAEELEAYTPKRAHIEVDGRDASGEFLLASVMNLRSVGPALGFAPEALFDDGLLDVVIVRPEHKASFLAHLKRAVEHGDAPLPRFETHRAEHVRFHGQGRWAHVDDCACELAGQVDVRVEPRTVRFLVPASA